MIRTRTGSSVLSLLYTPLCVVLLLFGLFGLIWLRSGIVALAYDLRNVEEKNMEALKDRKILLAERAKLMSLVKIDGSYRQTAHGDKRYASASGYVFPDRLKVIQVKRNKGPEPYKASLAQEDNN